MSYVENALSKVTGLLFRGAGVRRCHTYHLSRENTVGEHSFRVLLLYWQLAKGTIGLDQKVMEAILLHDLAECVTGDIPAPMKNKLTKTYPNDVSCLEETFLRTIGFPYVDEYACITEFDKRVVKLLDSLDLLILCWEERFNYGNRSLYPMHHRAWVYYANKHSDFMDLLTHVGYTSSQMQFAKDCQSLGQKFICTSNGEPPPVYAFGNTGEFYR